MCCQTGRAGIGKQKGKRLAISGRLLPAVPPRPATTPTLFLGGEKDFNVPITGGEQMYMALRTLGIPTRLVVYPGQYHFLTRRYILGWHARYLKPTDAPP